MDEFVELGLDRHPITVLAVLDQEGSRERYVRDTNRLVAC